MLQDQPGYHQYTLPQEQVLPVALRPIWQRHLQAIDTAVSDAKLAWPESQEFWQSVLPVCTQSDFVALNLARHPEQVLALFTGGMPSRYQPKELLSSELGFENALEQIRLARIQAMVGIAWRDLAGWASLQETMTDLSQFADDCIQQALAYCQQHLQLDEIDFVVLAMGKLGAKELNFSSDIDLIFTYDARQSPPADKVAQLGQLLIDMLHRQTDLGRVFRVDMRLRPYGNSGALVPSIASLIHYYHQEGRDWERYALIKYRAVTGLPVSRQRLRDGLLPFIYRPYVDFAMQSAIREMKHMIEQEVLRKHLQQNIKLGSGGIREVEFIVQALQLIHGGQYPALQCQSLAQAAAKLVAYDLLPEADAKGLLDAYEVLRQVEHKLQMVKDKQTHDLPTSELERCRLAYAMAQQNWQVTLEQIDSMRQQISTIFQQLLAHVPLGKSGSQSNPSVRKVSAKKLGGLSRLRAKRQSVSFSQSSKALQLDHVEGADDLLIRCEKQGVPERIIKQLLSLVSNMEKAAQQCSEPEAALKMALSFMRGLITRSTYIALLEENQQVLPVLLQVMQSSTWVHTLLQQHPMLLGQLVELHKHSLNDLSPIDHEIQRFTAGIAVDDQERWMEALRHVKLSRTLAVAVARIMANLPLMRESDYLTELAIAVIDQVFQLAWQSMENIHGSPVQHQEQSGFAIIAYGKLGGIELSYASDLDLVFLYEASQEETNGDKPISVHEFYARLAQKMMHYLRTQTYSGALYEVDLRLRPSGKSGLLVSRVDAFAQYQADSAWTWEHQALVRARGIVGDGQVIQSFGDVRRRVLSKQRSIPELKADIRDMRNKMKAQETDKVKSLMIDIEFMVQYLVLAHSHEHESLFVYPDNVRILEACAQCDLLSQTVAEQLTHAYLACRNHLHAQALQLQLTPLVPEGFADIEAHVLATWQLLLNS